MDEADAGLQSPGERERLGESPVSGRAAIDGNQDALVHTLSAGKRAHGSMSGAASHETKHNPQWRGRMLRMTAEHRCMSLFAHQRELLTEEVR